MKMVALKEFRYAGKQLAVGDPFDAREKDVRVLQAIKNACPDTEENQPDEPGDEEESSPRKRTYKRRDMKAE